MPCRYIALLIAVVCLIAQVARAAETKHAITKEVLMVSVRDGVKLAAEVWRPDAEGKFPALLLLRYWQTGHDEAAYFAPKGYAVVMVDSRGRGKSEGKWELYVNEPKDGYDVHQWLGVQPWCNGKIGTFGQSYNAFTQLMPAVYGSEYVKCLFPVEGQETNFGHIYNDGVMQLNMVFTAGLDTTGPTAVLKHRPIDDPFFRRLPLLGVAKEFPDAVWIGQWFGHRRFDDYWKRYGIYGKYDKIKAPAYITTGWYDNLVHEGFKVFNGLRKHGGSNEAREQTRIRVGDKPHGGAWGQFELMNRWYDYWLRDVQNGIDKEPAVQVQVMGTDRWRTGDVWPFPQVKYTPYYLISAGKANSSAGDGRLVPITPPENFPQDRYTYDPENPVYTLGGQISTNPEIWGAQDRQKTQTRNDILVYTTPPLEKDTEVTGEVVLKLFAASSAVDTDFTATLTDVHPNGKAVHVCEGIRGVTFRESLEHPTPIEPGKVYEYTISLWETSMLFPAGHRIRLEISSSNFPRYARNQNTGLPFGTSAEIKKAEQTIYHDAEHPSRLILPIMPVESARQKTERFDRDPNWDAQNNRVKVETPNAVVQDFGYSKTNHAGGNLPGEIGGRVQRASRSAFYGMRLDQPKTLDGKLRCSGSFAVTQSSGTSCLYFGWFNSKTPESRPYNWLGFCLAGERTGCAVNVGYRTAGGYAGGPGRVTGYGPGWYAKPKVRDIHLIPADGMRYTFELTYDPGGADGAGEITFTLGGTVPFTGGPFRYKLPPEHRKSGATFDSFGIINALSSGNALTAYFDDLVIDGRAESFDADPNWVAQGNRARFDDYALEGAHQFGFSDSAFAGGSCGELGGLLYSSRSVPGYYADKIGRLTLDDRLTASGKIALERYGSDGGMYLGWFDSRKRGHPPANILGVLIDGTTSTGPRFRGFAASGDPKASMRARDTAPVIPPDGKPHTWKIDYDPASARLAVWLDDRPDSFVLSPEMRKAGATFDRFGLFVHEGGGRASRIYVDDLEYTSADTQ
jgi:uncharacterized protein